MSKEIKELEDKYLVLKWDDIKNIGDEKKAHLKFIIDSINYNRAVEGKKDNHYVVLNLDDETDMFELRYRLFQDGFYNTHQKVKDIAIDLVNAILKAKE